MELIMVVHRQEQQVVVEIQTLLQVAQELQEMQERLILEVELEVEAMVLEYLMVLVVQAVLV